MRRTSNQKVERLNGDPVRLPQGIEWLLFLLALVLVPLILIQVSTTDRDVLAAVELVNALIWLAFAAELVYVARLTRSARTFLRERWLDIAIVVLSPPLLVPAELSSLRVLRLLRLVRLLAVVGRLQQHSGRAMGRQGILYVAILAAFFVFIGGVSIHELEPERAPTVWDGLWWAVVTLTTVGYGDISPATFEGRVLATFLMVSGLAVIGALAGSVGAVFLAQDDGGIEERLDHIQRAVDEIESRLPR